MTDPGRIAATISALIRRGASRPAISAVVITQSASATWRLSTSRSRSSASPLS